MVTFPADTAALSSSCCFVSSWASLANSAFISWLGERQVRDRGPGYVRGSPGTEAEVSEHVIDLPYLWEPPPCLGFRGKC